MGSRRIAFALTAAISAIRIGMGYFLSVSGPNLLYLAHNVRVPVSTFSFVFSGGSVGIVIGAIAGAVMKERVKMRQLYTLGIASLGMAMATSAIPLIEVFWLFFLNFFLGGILFGCVDAGVPALILDLWNEKKSRFHIQLIHFMFSVGAFVAPFVTKAFTRTNEDVNSERYCHVEIVKNSSTDVAAQENSTNQALVMEDFDGRPWTYYVLTIWVVPAAATLVILGYLDTEGRISHQETKSSSVPTPTLREDDPFREVGWVLISIMGYYMCIVGMDSIMHNFLFSAVLCSHLNFTVEQASIVNSLQWLGLGVGRLTAVLSAKFIQPKAIIICGLSASTCVTVAMSVFGERYAWVTWAGSFAHGFAGSALFPSGISWISGVTNVSGSYMFIFALGSTLGLLTVMPLGGYMFDRDSFSVIYLVAAASALAGIFFFLSVWAAHRFEFRHNTDPRIQEKPVDAENETVIATSNLLREDLAI